MCAACAMAGGIPRSLRYAWACSDEARHSSIRGATAMRAAASSCCQRGISVTGGTRRTASGRKEDGGRGATRNGGERVSLLALCRSSPLPRLPPILGSPVSTSTVAWQQWQKPQPVLGSIERESVDGPRHEWDNTPA